MNNFERIKGIAESVKEAHSKNAPVCFTCDRVSSKKQEDNTSLRAQKERGLKYAQENGFIIAENFSFIESASKKVRKNFHAMMNEAIKFNIDIVIFKTVDRLARNLPDIQLVLDFIYDHKRAVHLYDDGLRLTPEMDSNDALNFMLKGVLAKGETDRMGQRIRKAYEFKIQNGVKPGKAIFGYRYNSKRLKHEIDPETKHILEYIFSSFDNQEISCKELADLLNRKGYTTGERGIPWTFQNVYKILVNPTYHGEFYSKGKLIKAHEQHHEAYYPKERYLERIKKLEGNRGGLKINQIQDPLIKFVQCAGCSVTMTPDIKRKKSGRQYQYYIHKCKVTENGNQVTIPQERMFSLIDEKIQELRFSEDFFSNLKYWVRGEIQEKNKEQDEAIKKINRQIESIRRKKDRLLDLYAEDALDLDEFKQKREGFEDEIEQLLETKNAILNIEERRITDSICSTIDQIKELPILYLTVKNPYQKAELLKKMVIKINMAGDQLNFTWKEPFSFLMKSKVIELKDYLEAKENDNISAEKIEIRASHLLRANQESIRTLIGEIKLNFRLWLLAS
jgi:DNA invertase Pin-like site-specific DNA recombinase